MKLMSVAAAAGICVFSLPAAGDAVALLNGDFESGESGWQVPKRQWRVEAGRGPDGTAAFVFEVPKGEKNIQWAQTADASRFPVEGGMGYRFSCWMNTDALKIVKGRELGLYFAAYNDKGRPVGGGGAVRVTDNAVRKDGWYRVEGVTRPLPASAVTGGVYFYSGGCEGRAYIDGVAVEPLALNPVDRLTVSAYRAEAWEGDVSFAAAYVVNPLKNPDSELVATLSYVTPKGKGSKVCVLADGIASATLPVSAFAYGKNEVTLVLSRRDGTELGRSSCFFRREAEPMFRKVTFDRYHRTIVDGKPFFPLGMYWKEITAEALTDYTNGPFNCLMSYSRIDEGKLDLCHRFGIKVIASLSGHFKEMSAAKLPQKAAEIDARYVRGRLRRFRSHPAVLAWYLADEVPACYEEILAGKREMVYELDPDHPTWIVLDKPGEVRTMIRGFDVIGMDPYPIGNRGHAGRTEIGIAAGWARTARKATYGFRPMWQVPQAFDWAIYRPEETNRPAVRMPMRMELRSMTWQAIAAGANGIVYYSFFDLLQREGWRKDRVAGGWADVCAVAAEVKAFEPVMFSDEPPPAVEGGDGDVAARAWSYDGKHRVVMANTLRKRVKGKVKVSGREVPYELGPIEVKFLRLDR